MFDLVVRNLPRNKPQLWAHPLRSAWRRLSLAAAPLFVPGWLDRPRVISLAHFGLRMEVVAADAIGRALYLYGLFEVRETTFVRAALRRGDLFVDVGANAGYYTLLASRIVGNDGAVVALEPSPRVRERLERNVRLNDLRNVTIRAQALAAEEGEAPLFVSEDPNNSGIASLRPGAGRAAAPQMVAATTLDEIAEELDRPIDLLKVDVEGAELEVFAGGGRTLSGPDAPAIVFETFGDTGVFEALGKAGYEVRALRYDPRSGLRFDADLGARDAFSSYEAPSFVALKGKRRFDELG
jgi:FkbM family methyltransferase